MRGGRTMTHILGEPKKRALNKGLADLVNKQAVPEVEEAPLVKTNPQVEPGLYVATYDLADGSYTVSLCC